MLKMVSFHDNSVLNDDIISMLKDHLGRLGTKQDSKKLISVLHDAILSHHARLFVLYNEELPIAFAFGNIGLGLESGGRYFWMNELYVKPAYRNQGFGHKLLEELEKLLKAQNINYVALVTGKDNIEATEFYHKEGYQEQNYQWFDKELK